MRINWTLITNAIIALAPILAAVIAAARGPNAIRTRLKHDSEILEKLPDSAARTSLLELIHTEVETLRTYDTVARREYGNLVLAFVGSAGLGYLAFWLFRQDTWWGYLTAAPCGLLATACLYGIFESAQRVPRDNKGQRKDSTLDQGKV